MMFIAVFLNVKKAYVERNFFLFIMITFILKFAFNEIDFPFCD